MVRRRAGARLLASVKYATWKPTQTKWRSLAPCAKGRPLWLFRSTPSFVARRADLRVGLTGSAGGSGIERVAFSFHGLVHKTTEAKLPNHESHRHVCD